MSHHGIFTTLLMGAAIAEFGLTGISGPSGDGAAEPQNERSTALVQQHLPAGIPEVPGSRIVPQDISAEEYSAAVMTTIMPPAASGGPPQGFEVPRAEMAQDVDQGVYYLDRSVRQIPAYAMKMVGQVEQHGIAALAYDDPEMKRAGHDLGAEVGMGIRHLVSALGKDMVATSQESLGSHR